MMLSAYNIWLSQIPSLYEFLWHISEFEDDSKHLMSYACTATIDDVSWAIRFNMNNVIESNESVYRTIDYRSVVVTKRLKSYWVTMLSIGWFNMLNVIEYHETVWRTIEYCSDKAFKIIQSHGVVYLTIENRID